MSPKRKRRARPHTRRSRTRKSGDYAFCPFCGGPLDFSSVAGVKGALAEGQDISGRGGTMVQIDLCGIGVPAVVANQGSPLEAEGFQVVFLLCSNECARAVALAAALDHLLAGRDPNLSQPHAAFGLRLKKNGESSDARVAELMDALMKALPPDAAERLDAKLPRLSIVH